MTETPQIWVYENWRAHGRKAVVHRATCGFCNDGAGLMAARVPNTAVGSDRSRRRTGPGLPPSTLGWAREAWRELAAASLTNYRTSIQRHRVIFRFIALADLYHDFCEIAFDETSIPDYVGWAAHFELDPFQIGRLIGASEDLINRWDEYEGYEWNSEEVIRGLADEARREIVPALTSDSFSFFISLLESKSALMEDSEPYSEPADEVIRMLSSRVFPVIYEDENGDYATYNLLRSLGWIEDGCPARLNWWDGHGQAGREDHQRPSRAQLAACASAVTI